MVFIVIRITQNRGMTVWKHDNDSRELWRWVGENGNLLLRRDALVWYQPWY